MSFSSLSDGDEARAATGARQANAKVAEKAAISARAYTAVYVCRPFPA
jgi:hypothetical protein